MPDNFKLLLRLYYQPLSAMSGILDHGSWLFGAAAVVILSCLLHFQTVSQFVTAGAEQHLAGQMLWMYPFASIPSSFFLLAVVYVPVTILLITWFEPVGGFMVVLFRDYAPLLACLLMGWSAAFLPVVVLQSILAGASPGAWNPQFAALGYVLFIIYSVCALRILFGSSFAKAAIVVLIAIPSSAFVLLYGGILRGLLSYLASPFLLYYAYRYFSGDLQALGAGLRSRQNFRRQLEAAAVNPHDADAQTQLGLIYEQRRQYSEAVRRFQNAIAIDSHEPEPHFHLGRIAREQDNYTEALARFQTVAKLDPKYSGYEVWREAGAVYIAQRRYSDALPPLQHYVEQRQYDAEGLYYLGLVLEKTGDVARAREMYERCVAAVRTAPQHRVRLIARWSRLAQKQLSTLGKSSSGNSSAATA